MRKIDRQLRTAANRGNCTAIERLIAEGADVNAQDDAGWTAVQTAAMEGHADAAQILINAGANADAKDEYGWSLLHDAAICGHAATLEVLIRAGADLTKQTTRDWANIPAGSTPRDAAAQEGHAGIVALIDEALAARSLQDKSSSEKRHRIGL